MICRGIIFILGTLLAAQPFAESQAADPTAAAATPEHRGSPAGAIITVSLIAAAGAGVGGYFFYRKQMKERRHAD